MAEKRFSYEEHQRRMRERIQPQAPKVNNVLQRLMQKARERKPRPRR